MINVTNAVNDKIKSIDQTNFKELVDGINQFKNNTEERINFFTSIENTRALATILIFLFYLIMISLAFWGFFKRKPNFLLAISIILLFTLPFLIVYEGYVATFYFVYTDLCQDVHDAIYANKFPIADKGLGFYINCFNSKSKSNLYAYSFEITKSYDDIKAKLNSNLTSSADFETYKKLESSIEDLQKDTLKDLMECSHVYESILFIENRFCLYGMKWSNYLISSYSWLFLIIFISSYAINRMKPVVEKKKSEIEVKIYFILF